MKHASWMGLALALLVGCDHNLVPPAHWKSTASAPSSGNRRFSSRRTQVAFVNPIGMKVGWEVSVGEGTKTFLPGQLGVPGRYNFSQGAIYRLKLTDVPDYGGVPFYPTLEVAPASPRTDAYLTHNAVPVEFTNEDFDQVSAGNFVTKVIYLPDPQHQELAIAGVETLVSTRLDPGVDPIAEADRRGTILALVRLGGIDLELVQTLSVSSSTGSQGSAAMIAPDQAPGSVVVQRPQNPIIYGTGQRSMEQVKSDDSAVRQSIPVSSEQFIPYRP